MKSNVVHFLGLIAILLRSSFCPAAATPVEPVKVHLDVGKKGQLRVLIQGELAATLADPNGNPQSFATNSIHLHRAKADEITLDTQSSPLILTMEGFPGWQAEVPGMSRTVYHIDQPLNQLNIQTGSANKEAVAVTLPDGALARLSANSRGRMAMFKGGAYSFYGDGAVSAIDADGKTNILSRRLPPLRGGPLRETVDTNGTPRMTRVTPLLKLVISGDVGGPITIDGGGQHTVLEPNIDPPVEYDNGSVLNFDNMSQSKQVKCQVIKGDVELSISGIDGWKAVMQTGQTAGVEFDRARSMVDLKSLDEGPPVLVLLSSKTIAEIEPKSTFQYAYVNRSTFATSATGPGVQLYDTRTSRETKLTEDNLLFVGGIPQGHGPRPTSSDSLAIAWDGGSPLEVNGLSSASSIPPGDQKIMKFAADKELAVNYNKSGELEIQAIQGNYTLRLSALQGLSVNVAMGDTVILQLDLKQNTFIVRSGDANSNPVTVLTADGFNPGIDPSKALNFNFGKGGLIKATSSDGSLFDFTVAGANNNNPATGTSNPLGTGGSSSTSQNIDVTRVVEAALSTKR